MNTQKDTDVKVNHLILNEIEKIDSTPSIQNQNHIIYEKGDNGFDSSDTQENFYFIIDGKIKISQINIETGKEQTLYLLSKGDMFDVVTLLDNDEHEYVSEVLEKSYVVEVPISTVRRLIESNIEFQSMFFPYMAKQLRRMEDLVTDISLYDVYHRIIRLFTRFTNNKNGDNSLSLIENLSHEELASMVGSVRKVVNRNLQKLKDEGVIELSRKHIKLKNFQKLLDKLHF